MRFKSPSRRGASSGAGRWEPGRSGESEAWWPGRLPHSHQGPTRLDLNEPLSRLGSEVQSQRSRRPPAPRGLIVPILAGSKAGSLSLPAACPSPQLLPGWSAAPHAKSESPMPPHSAPHSAHHARPGPQCTPALRSDPPPGLPRTLWPDSFLESPHGALTLAPRGAHSCISWCTGPLRGGSRELLAMSVPTFAHPASPPGSGAATSSPFPAARLDAHPPGLPVPHPREATFCLQWTWGSPALRPHALPRERGSSQAWLQPCPGRASGGRDWHPVAAEVARPTHRHRPPRGPLAGSMFPASRT